MQYKPDDIIHMEFKITEIITPPSSGEEVNRIKLSLSYSTITLNPTVLQFTEVVDEKRENYKIGDIVHIPFKIETYTKRVVALRALSMYMNIFTDRFLEIVSHYNS